MSQFYNAEAHAVEAIMAIEKAGKVLSKRAYRAAKEILATHLRNAFIAGQASGVREATDILHTMQPDRRAS